MTVANEAVFLKDAFDETFGPMLIVDIGSSGSPLYVPAHTVLDEYGNPSATNTNPLFVSPIQHVLSGTFTRPADTNPYSNGDLVANSTNPTAVVPLAWNFARYAGGSASVVRAHLLKSAAVDTHGVFRLHLYKSSPVAVNGDNAAWLTASSGYVGSFTFDFTGANVRVFTDGEKVIAVPDVGTSAIIETVAPSLQIFGLVEYIAPSSGEQYTPGSAEVFTFSLEVQQN
jgi:hypothetical protein